MLALLQGAGLRWQRFLRRGMERIRDTERGSAWRPHHAHRLRTCMRRAPTLSGEELAGLRAASELYMQHRFDILGSGWVTNAYGVTCPGFEGHSFAPGQSVIPDREGSWLQPRINRSNLRRSQVVWKLVDPGYSPIDWQLDVRSGYRWSEATWSGDITAAGPRATDIKVPWEMARMQHLPQLALAAAGDGYNAAVYRREYRNQVLDFIAANPLRFGVNWQCTMEVGIRAANWIMAHDLFLAQGDRFDDDFEAALAWSLHEHGEHIRTHLEWYPVFRSNHYIANVVGLLFVAACLPRGRRTRSWLRFAARELLRETAYQFYGDGGNHEASTCYHRLSAELVAWGTVMLQGLDETLPRVHLESLQKMGELLVDVTRPDGALTQLGDNDSGRLFSLVPCMRVTAIESGHRAAGSAAHVGSESVLAVPEIETLDARPTVGVLGVASGSSHLLERANGAAGDASVATALAKMRSFETRLPSWTSHSVTIGDDTIWRLHQTHVASRPAADVLHRAYGADTEELERFAYPEFGVYGFRARGVYLVIRCGRVGQRGLGAHDHNDQLSIELVIGGVDVERDPGSFTYLAFPEIRNEYRSVAAHSGPRIGTGEPASLEAGLFALGSDPRAECHYFSSRGFIGSHAGHGPRVYRRIEINRRGIELTDWAEQGRPWVTPIGERPRFSPRYGVRLA